MNWSGYLTVKWAKIGYVRQKSSQSYRNLTFEAKIWLDFSYEAKIRKLFFKLGFLPVFQNQNFVRTSYSLDRHVGKYIVGSLFESVVHKFCGDIKFFKSPMDYITKSEKLWGQAESLCILSNLGTLVTTFAKKVTNYLNIFISAALT